jgi:hypothetical protein
VQAGADLRIFSQNMKFLVRKISDLQHFDSVQIRMLKDVESLKDVTVRFGYVVFGNDSQKKLTYQEIFQFCFISLPSQVI